MDAPRSASARLDIPRPRRVATAPISVSAPAQRPTTPSSVSSSSSAPPAPAAAPEELVETLYNHPAVRIISFTSSRHGFTTFTPDNDVQPGSLPPSSQLERTIAVGAFCIYRAPGSVAFLSCGSALQPILPRSQCWCIDEDNSRFVLQIRRPQYWRIEVPVDDPDDALRAELLRDVFDKILLFEKTECPFQRSFTVQLPDPPETPVKKKAWTAEGKNLLSSPFQSDLSPPAQSPMAISRGKRTSNIPREIYSLANFESAARHARLEQQEERDEEEGDQPTGKVRPMIEVHESRDALSAMSLVVPRPAGGMREFATLSDNTSTPPGATIARTRDDYSLSGQRNNDSLDSLDSDHSSSEDNPASFEGSGGVAPINLARKRRTRMLAGRSFTAPSQLTLVTTPPSKSNKPVTVNKTIPPQPQPSRTSFHSPSASTDSFHSVQSWHSSMGPPDLTKPESDELLESSSQVNYSSDHTTTPKNSVKVVPSSLVVPDSCGSAEPTPRPAEFITDKQPEESNNNESEARTSRLSAFENNLRTRPRSHTGTLAIRRRALSPLPPAANLFSPPRRQTSQSRLAAIRRLPSVIIQKTIKILLSPPSYLLQLILKVAAMIVAGEWRGLVFGFSDEGEQIPVEWDYYSDGEFSDLSDSDDYTLTAHGSSYGDNVPRTNVRRRTRYTRNDGYDSCGVD